MSPRSDLTGQVFGHLTILYLVGKRNNSNDLLWAAKCSNCDVVIHKSAASLKAGYYNCPLCTLIHAISTPKRLLYSNYQDSAKKRNHEFALSYELFSSMIHKECYYCGMINSCHWEGGKSTKFSFSFNGIDRVDNKIGYTPSNCVTSCKFCNYAKNRWTVEEFQAWLTHVRSSGKLDSINVTEG